MMLRSRNPNVMNQQAGQAAPTKPGNDHPVKRGAAKQLQEKDDKENVGGEPKAKKAVLSELRNQISSGLLIDSVRKAKGTKGDVKRNSRRSNSSSEALQSVSEENKCTAAGDESIVVIEETAFDPCPEYDYDAENKGDPFNVPDYAFDIFRYYRSRESCFAVQNYFTKHANINKDNRAVLIDWMIEVQETFELNHETLYLAVKLVDLYLNNTSEEVSCDDLQLIACAAVFVASKYDERQPPLVDDFLYVTGDKITREGLEDMERNLLKTVCFDLGSPLSYRYLRRYAKATKVDMQLLTLGRYILETSLMFFEFAVASEAKVSAGAFLLACRMLDKKAEWTSVLHKYSGLSPQEVEPWCWELNHMMHKATGVNQKLHTAYDKYSHEVFFQSAAVPLLPSKYDLSRALQTPE